VASVLAAANVQQHHLLSSLMVTFDAQLWLYAQLLVRDGRQHARCAYVVLLSGLTCLGCLDLLSGGLTQPVQSPSFPWRRSDRLAPADMLRMLAAVWSRVCTVLPPSERRYIMVDGFSDSTLIVV